MPGVQKPHCVAWKPAMRSWTAWNPDLLLPRPSEVVMEQPSMLQRSVRHELAVKSSTLSRSGSYFERRTTQAPQPPVCPEKTR